MHETANLDDGYLGSGHQLVLAIKKYGRENFQREILYQLETQADMIAKEAELVTEEFVQRKRYIQHQNRRIGRLLPYNWGE